MRNPRRRPDTSLSQERDSQLADLCNEREARRTIAAAGLSRRASAACSLTTGRRSGRTASKATAAARSVDDSASDRRSDSLSVASGTTVQAGDRRALGAIAVHRYPMRLRDVARLDGWQAIRRSRLPDARARSCATLREVVAAATDLEATAAARSQRRRATSPRVLDGLRCAARSGAATGVAARPSCSLPLRCYEAICRSRSAVRLQRAHAWRLSWNGDRAGRDDRVEHAAPGARARRARTGRIGVDVRDEPTSTRMAPALGDAAQPAVRRARAARRRRDARARPRERRSGDDGRGSSPTYATSALARYGAPVCRVPRRLRVCPSTALLRRYGRPPRPRPRASTLIAASRLHVARAQERCRRNARPAATADSLRVDTRASIATASGRARRGQGRSGSLTRS